MSIAVTTAVGNDMADAAAALIGADSILELRTGAAPGPNNAATGTLLCSITITGSFTVTSNALSAAAPAQTLPSQAGTAAHFRLKTSGGTAILEGTVGVVGSGADLELDTVALLTSVPVVLGVPTFTVPLS